MNEENKQDRVNVVRNKGRKHKRKKVQTNEKK